MNEYRMIRDANGVKHKFKLKSKHYDKPTAKKEADKWKHKGYNIRIITGRELSKKIHKVFAFALWD